MSSWRCRHEQIVIHLAVARRPDAWAFWDTEATRFIVVAEKRGFEKLRISFAFGGTIVDLKFRDRKGTLERPFFVNYFSSTAR